MARVSWKRGAPPPAELALAVIVTAAMAVSLNQARYPLLSLLLVLPTGLSLAWRVRWPVVPLALNSITYVAVFGTAPPPYGPQTLFLGLLVALYSAAVALTGRAAVLAGGLSLLAVWVGFVLPEEGNAADFFPFLVWGAPWLAGRLVRRQTLQARAAGARAALLEVEAREATSRERDRIARELHDVVGHAVSLMVVQAGAARLVAGPGHTREVLETIETTGREALVELRAMLGVLRATDGRQEFAPQPDLSAVPALVEAVRDAGLDVRLSVTGAGDVPAGVGLAGYRVVQEALTNAMRYGVGTAVVRLEAADEVVIEVRNPRGRVGSIGAGVGLVGMRERVELLGGTLEAGAVGGEWVVTARIPGGRAA